MSSVDKALGGWGTAFMFLVSLGIIIAIISSYLNYGVKNFGIVLIIIGIICGYIGIIKDKLHNP